jgi:hypothetical protein
LELLQYEDFVEYRDRKLPLQLGDTKERRRSSVSAKKFRCHLPCKAVSRKTSSPYFRRWEEVFKDSIKKTGSIPLVSASMQSRGEQKA